MISAVSNSGCSDKQYYHITYSNSMNIVLLLIITTVYAAVNTTKYYYEILPTNTYINVNGTYFTQASPQACYADCQSCQIQTLAC